MSTNTQFFDVDKEMAWYRDWPAYSKRPDVAIRAKKHHRARTVYQYTTDGVLVREWDSVADISNECEYDREYLYETLKCKKNNAQQAYGYVWSYTPINK